MPSRRRSVSPTGLTSKQSKFVAEYMVDGNATKAAKRAGYSPRTAHIQGSRVLNTPKVREAIRKLENQNRARSDVSIDYLMKGYQKIAENVEEATRDRLHAYDSLGRCLGAFQADLARGQINVNVAARTMTDEEVVQQVRERLDAYERRRLK